MDNEKDNEEEKQDDLSSYLDGIDSGDEFVDEPSDVDTSSSDEAYDIDNGMNDDSSDNGLLTENDFIEPENDDNPFDVEHFKLYIKNPSEIDEFTLDSLSKLIDGKYSDDFRNIKLIVSKPDTVEQLKNSDLVEYITYDGSPVGVLTVTNPLQENYLNIVPGEIYSLQTGYNLDNRVEIEYFVISSEYDEFPVAEELLNQLIVKGIKPYMVCPADDYTTNSLLKKLHFKYISTFNLDVISDDINLYVVE